jgi:hypothetical protein
LTVDRLTYTKGRTFMPVEQTTLPGLVSVLDRSSCAQDFKYSVVEALRSFDVVGTEHHMTEQGVSPVLKMVKHT